MVIIINKLLSFFYNFINNNDIKYDNNYFIYKNDYYTFIKIDGIRIFNNFLDDYHIIVKNKFNSLITYYNNEKYVLLKVRLKEKNRLTCFDDLVNITKKYINNIGIKNNYFELWNSKISFIENYCTEKFNNNYDLYYYIGLSYIALNIVKKINNQNITYGNSYSRFYNIKSLYDLYNPFNTKISPIVDSFVEFIKYKYFYDREEVDYSNLFSIKLTNEDYYYLVARLIFPTYYFDIINDIDKKYNVIVNRIESYIMYIKEIILDIKKRQDNLPLLDIIINQL